LLTVLLLLLFYLPLWELRSRRARYAVILGFDLSVDQEAQRLANQMGVRIFMAPSSTI